MAKEDSPDEVGRKTFVVTMIGAVFFVAASFGITFYLTPA